MLIPIILLSILSGCLAVPLESTNTLQHGVAKPVFKAMIVGDSLSHGHPGDHTWRYRLWQWLRSTSSNVDPHFVGPFNGTWLDSTNRTDYFHDGGPYATDVNPAFLAESYHAAVWGRPLSWSQQTIAEWLKAHDADWVLLLMGYNDFAWFHETVNTTLPFMEKFIVNARSVRPDLKFLIGNVPDQDQSRMVLNTTREYNRRLPELLSRYDKPESPIHLVDISRTYNCGPGACPDG